jgi:hypothetical protein
MFTLSSSPSFLWLLIFCSSTLSLSRSITILWKKSSMGISLGLRVLSAGCSSMVPPCQRSPSGTSSFTSLQSRRIFSNEVSTCDTVSTSALTLAGINSSRLWSVLSTSLIPWLMNAMIYTAYLMPTITPGP